MVQGAEIFKHQRLFMQKPPRYFTTSAQMKQYIIYEIGRPKTLWENGDNIPRNHEAAGFKNKNGRH